ncbi:MAG: hypothetical protein RL456_1630 [Pseudomonadota bacterium]
MNLRSMLPGWLARAAATPAPAARYASSPLLTVKTPALRSRLVVAALGLLFCVLIGRALYIQVIGNDFYQKQGEMRYQRRLELPALRGRITDRNGHVLASSTPTPSVWAIPKDFQGTPEQARELARLLGMSPGELAARLRESRNFVWLRRLVSDEVAAQIKALGIKGVHLQREYRREYTNGEAIAHLVGFTDLQEKGQEGIELAFQNDLQGRNGSRTVVRDRLGRVVEDLGDQVEPVDGRNIELSIDHNLQAAAYRRLRDAVQEHKARAGSIVALDVQTGEVLALVNYPSFDPADRSTRSGANLRNRALTDTFEPGSTMKPFVAALALQSGRVKPETVIQTAPGSITITGSTIRDSHPHGLLTVEQIIQKSSNVGTVKMAMQMQPREMWEMFSAVGIGRKPDLSFPGLAAGRLRPYRSWRPIEQATMSYGYGLSSSLFQLARAYTVFARDGQLVPVSLVHTREPAEGVQVLRPEVARAVRRMLHMAAGEGGTAPKAQAIGYSVGGKTGTAHKQEGKGYAGNKYRAWFVGMAPIQSPRVVIAVMIDEPSNGRYFGGDVAAPVFSQVVQQALQGMGVPPDLQVQPQIVARAHSARAEEESF